MNAGVRSLENTMPYMSALAICPRRGAIQIHAHVYLTLEGQDQQLNTWTSRRPLTTETTSSRTCRSEAKEISRFMTTHKRSNILYFNHHCKQITVPTASPCHCPCTHASLNALPTSEHKSSPTRPPLSHTMLTADFILKAIPPVVSFSELLVFRQSDVLPFWLT